MAGGNVCRVVQVTNIAPQATKDQMQTLFAFMGKIEEIRLYPSVRDVSCPVQSRICYVRYADADCVPLAQHLTNTVFIDRALIVIPVLAIPEEYRALEMSKNGTIVPGLHKQEQKQLPPEVVNRIEGQLPQQVIKTYDPKLVDNNLPEYPALPAFYDVRKIEEIRRTIIVCDAKSDWRLNELMECFQRAGEVKYARWAEKDDKSYCMIEFCEQSSVINALKMQGLEFRGGYLNVYHSTDAIVKPEAKSNEVAQAEIAEAMTIVKEAQNMISAAIDPVIGMLAKEKRRHTRSRSRSVERHSKSRSCSHRSRSHRRSRSRKRSCSKSKRRSRSRSHSRRSRTRSPRKHRSKRSSSRHRRSSSRSRRSSSRHRHRSRSRNYKKSSHRTRDEKHARISRSPSPRLQTSRSSKYVVSFPKSSSSSSKPRSRTPDRRKHYRRSNIDDIEVKSSRSSADYKSRRSMSLEKSDNMDISNSP